MLKSAKKLYSAAPHSTTGVSTKLHDWPETLATPDTVLTQEYFEKKYPNHVMPTEQLWLHRIVAFPLFKDMNTWEGKWSKHIKAEKHAQKIWISHLLHHDPFGTNAFVNWGRYIDWIAGAILAALTFPFIYIVFLMKTEFQKRNQWFIGSPLAKRGAPFVPNPWDKVKRGEDGHYYIGKERLD